MSIRKENISARSANTTPLKDILQDLFKEYRIEKKVSHAQLKNDWPKIVGKSAAKRTEKIYFRNKVMFIQFSSASLRQELSMKKQFLLKRIREDYAADLVEEIIFM